MADVSGKVPLPVEPRTALERRLAGKAVAWGVLGGNVDRDHDPAELAEARLFLDMCGLLP